MKTPPGTYQVTVEDDPDAVIAESEFGLGIENRSWSELVAARFCRRGRPAAVVSNGGGRIAVLEFRRGVPEDYKRFFKGGIHGV